MHLVQVENADGRKIFINLDNLITLRSSMKAGWTDVHMIGVNQAISIKGDVNDLAESFRKAIRES